MKILSFLKSIFGIFGHIWGALIWTIRPILEVFGFVHPRPEDIAGDIGEDALDHARSQRSLLDRRPVEKWTTIQRFDAISRWAAWKVNGRSGPEPSLAGFTLRERMKIKQARSVELNALVLRYPHEIEAWLTGPAARLTPLKEAELGQRRPEVNAMLNESEEWQAALANDMAYHGARSAVPSAKTASLLAETNELMVRTSALLGMGRQVSDDPDYAATPTPRFAV
jgi:hypothetical protein